MVAAQRTKRCCQGREKPVHDLSKARAALSCSGWGQHSRFGQNFAELRVVEQRLIAAKETQRMRLREGQKTFAWPKALVPRLAFLVRSICRVETGWICVAGAIWEMKSQVALHGQSMLFLTPRGKFVLI